MGSFIVRSFQRHYTSGQQQLRQDTRVDAVVRMSPQQAKASLRALKKAIEDYEAKYGEIHIPPEVPNANTPIK
jgi:hypothetical protein